MKVMKKKIFIAFFYLWIFVIFAIIMTFSDNNSMFEQTALNICVFDEDNTSESRALCDLIDKDNEIVTLENDRDIILDALYYERADYVLTIKKGYAEKLAAGDTDDLFESMKMHDSYSTVYMGQFLNEYVGTVSAFIAGGNDVTTSVSKAADVLSQEAEVSISAVSGAEDAFLSVNTSFFFRYLPYMILGAVMSTLCPVLIILGRKDVRYRTNCSGLHQSSYTTQLFAASAVYIIAIWLVFMIVGVFINGGMYSGKAWLAVLNSFVFTLFSAAMTIFVASFDPNNLVIHIVTQVLTLTTCFLGGVFVTQELLGDGVLAAARFMPTYWYIRIYRMLAGEEPFDGGAAGAALLIEAAFAAAFAVLTLLVRKARYGRASAVNV